MLRVRKANKVEFHLSSDNNRGEKKKPGYGALVEKQRGKQVNNDNGRENKEKKNSKTTTPWAKKKNEK